MTRQAATQTKSQTPTTSPLSEGGILQRKGEGNKLPLQRRATHQDDLVEIPPIVDEVLSSSGQPLDRETRTLMESRFQHDFSQVRIHTNAKAAESVQAVNANAYTVKQDIAFDIGKYTPASRAGKRLLAHELAHVVQQSRGGSDVSGLASNPSLEQGADQAATALTQSQAPVTVAGSSAPGLACQGNADLEDLRKKLIQQGVLQPEAPDATQTQPKIIWLGRNPGGLLEQAAQEGAIQMQQGRPIKLHQDGHPDADKIRQAFPQLNPQSQSAQQMVAKPLRNPLLPSVKYDDRQNLLDQVSLIQGITPSPTVKGTCTVLVEGTLRQLTQAEVDDIYQKTREFIRDGLHKVKSNAERAQSRYQSQSEIDKKHYVVAPIVHFLGGVRDPGPYLLAETAKALSMAAAAEAALNSNNFTQAATLLANSEASAAKATKLWLAYFEGIIGSGEMTITVLEVTRDVSFGIAIAAGAIVAAPVVAAGAGALTGAVGLSATGLTATGLTALGTGGVVAAGGAGLRATSAAGGSYLAQGKINWKDVKEEAKKGGKEGFVAGATAGLAPGVGKALGVGAEGASFGQNLARRAASEGIVNASGETVNAALEGKSVKDSFKAGGRGLVTGVVGGSLGSIGGRAVAGKPLLEKAIGAGVGGVTSGTGALLAGGSLEDAEKSALIGTISGASLAAAQHPGTPSKKPPQLTQGENPPITPPSRQLMQGENPPITPPSRQLTQGENPPVTPPARQLTQGENSPVTPPAPQPAVKTSATPKAETLETETPAAKIMAPKKAEIPEAETPATKTEPMKNPTTVEEVTSRMEQLRNDSQLLSGAAKADETKVRDAHNQYKEASRKADDLCKSTEAGGQKALTPEAAERNPALKDQVSEAQKLRKRLNKAEKECNTAEAEYNKLKAQQDVRYEQIRKNNAEVEKLSSPELALPPMQRGTVNELRVLKEEGLLGIKPQLTVRDPKTGEWGVTIPDGVRPNGRTVDVKDAAKLSETQQLRLQREYSRQRGQKPEIITGTKTKVPAEMEENYIIRRRPDLGPR